MCEVFRALFQWKTVCRTSVAAKEDAEKFQWWNVISLEASAEIGHPHLDLLVVLFRLRPSGPVVAASQSMWMRALREIPLHRYRAKICVGVEGEAEDPPSRVATWILGGKTQVSPGESITVSNACMH